jgi:drug/metabolite transporter (DMT)-like permease
VSASHEEGGASGIGVVLMLVATQIVPVMDGFAKYLSPRYPAWQLAWCRFFFHFLVLVPVVVFKFDRRELWPRQPLLQIIRGAFLVVATSLFFASIARIPLANALALLFCYPLIVSVLSPWLLGERPELGRWVAALVGFSGILVILRPGLMTMDSGSVLALLAGCAYSLYFLATRKLSGTAPPLVTLAYTAVFGAVVLTAAAPLYWVTPVVADLPYMAGIGLAAALGHYLIIVAFERAPASVLAPLGYGEIVMATLIGYFVFGDFPDRWTWLGIAIVIGSGTYVLLRERERRPVEALEPPS